MADTNHQHFHGSVSQVNGIKADNLYLDAKGYQKQVEQRSKLLKEILYYRHHCYELHIVLCNYAREKFNISGDFKFIDLTDSQLEQIWHFSQPFKKVVFVYKNNMKDKRYQWAYKLAFWFEKVSEIFKRKERI